MMATIEEQPVKHRESGLTGTVLAIEPGNPDLPDWHFHKGDWVKVRWSDGFVSLNRPDELEWTAL